MIANCTCRHDFQDRVHGHGRRVFNQLKTPTAMPRKYRCTVCGSTTEKARKK